METLTQTSFFRHPFFQFLIYQASVIIIGLGIGWAFATRSRLRALSLYQKRKLNGASSERIYHDRKPPESVLPPISVILPVKGVSPLKCRNWESQISSDYSGPIEFIFVVESKDDSAFPYITQLIQQKANSLNGSRSILLLVAGECKTCSQKIHNQIAGVERMSKESKYSLFLDDDIRVRPNTVTDLVTAMEEHPGTFIVTGYPVDVPTPAWEGRGGQLAAYCVLAFHLPLFIGFSTGGSTGFVWGGCMLMRSSTLRSNEYNIVSLLRDGGYSDDMTLAAMAGKHGLKIRVTDSSVFIHRLPNNFTLGRFWNYLRRQTFVLETYSSPYNRFLNRFLLLVHCYLSSSLVAPILIAVGYMWPSSAAARCLSDFASFAPLAMAVAFSGLLLRRMLGTVFQLCRSEDPRDLPPPFSIFEWHKVFLGIVTCHFLYPICAVYTVLNPDIEWAGVTYRRLRGKICKIVRGRSRFEGKG